MDKLNVCLVNDSFPPLIDGVANAVINYADIISRNYGNAAVVTPYHPQADDSKFAFPVLRYPSVDMGKFVGYRAGLPFSPEIMGRVESSNFDIIHSHCPITATAMSRAFRDRIDAPLVLSYHTKFDIDIANAVQSQILRDEAAKLLVENISACDEVWTVSMGAGENLRKLGYEGEYIVMPNGVDFPRGAVEPSLVEQICSGFDLPGDVPVFLFVGRMMWYKGIKIILDALKVLSDSGQNFRMVFVGGGNDKEEIMEYSKQLELGNKLLFLPPIQDRNIIRAWYCRADLFLFPSTFDTNGLVVREAAACSLASVLVAGSCAAEGVEDGVSGFLIEENAEAMAAKLKQLCPNIPCVKQVGEMACQKLYMSWERSVHMAVERYGQVIENYKSGLYPPHDKLSDELFHSMAMTMDALSRARQIQKQVRSSHDSLIADINDERQKLKDKFSDIMQLMDRFL